MKKLKFSISSICLLALMMAALGLSGCASADSENLSARPWNSPGANDSGLPSALTEGR
jgi:ABC-type oligopeptide transport system substrate-binding subunit